jgi:hypothetical protein
VRTSCRILWVLPLLVGGACRETDRALIPPAPSGAMSYTGSDENGRAVVTGWVKLDFAVPVFAPSIPVNLTGTWALRGVGSPGAIGPQIGGGNLEGLLQDGTLFVNFNPSRADDNVVAEGTFELIGGPAGGMRWEGTWIWSTLAGQQRTGNFRARS